MKKAFIFALLLAGCASYDKSVVVVNSPAEIPTIQQVYSGQLAQLQIGMSRTEFSRVMPDTYAAGQSSLTAAYALDMQTPYYLQSTLDWANDWGRKVNPEIYKQSLWFYFYKDRLVQWGRPFDWPQRPDIIIEDRIR